MKFADLGPNSVKDSTACKKIQYFSKTNSRKLYNNFIEFNFQYKKLADLYLNDSESSRSNAYSTLRQLSYSPSSQSRTNLSLHPHPKPSKLFKACCATLRQIPGMETKQNLTHLSMYSWGRKPFTYGVK